MYHEVKTKTMMHGGKDEEKQKKNGWIGLTQIGLEDSTPFGPKKILKDSSIRGEDKKKA